MARVDGAGSLPHVRATYCGTCEGVTITATSRHGTGDLYRLARVGPYEVRY